MGTQRTEGRDCTSESEDVLVKITQKCTKIGPHQQLQPRIRVLP